jgi:hypothetical protein
MKTPHNTPATRLALSTAGLILLVLLTVVPVARAVTIIKADLGMPDQSLLPFGSWPKTQNNPIIGTFDFGAAAASSLPAFRGFDITIGFGNLDTDYPSSGMPSGGLDFNNLTVYLGYGANMYSTGIKLNGFSNNPDTLLVFGDPNLAGNAANIFTALQASGGKLTMQIKDSTSLPSNPFYFIGGTATMSLADQAIPFEPTQTLGFGVLAALFAFRRFPQLKRFFARA